MYTILMKDDKSLITTVTATIYQREKLVDKIRFLLPQNYGELSLKDFMITFRYVDPSNTGHVEILTVKDELYKERLECVLPVDTKLSRFSGDNVGYLSFLRINDENGTHEEVLKTGSITITINPVEDIFIDGDESLNALDKRLAQMIEISKANALTANMLLENHADDLNLSEDGLLQITANGKPIGKGVLLDNDGCDCEEGVPVVDFTTVEPEGDIEVDNVVEF